MSIAESKEGQKSFMKYGKEEKLIVFFHNEESKSIETKKILEDLYNENESVSVLMFNVKEPKNLVFSKMLRVTSVPIAFFMRNGSPKNAVYGTLTKEILTREINKLNSKKKK